MGSFIDSILDKDGINPLNYDWPTIDSIAAQKVKTDYCGCLGTKRMLSDLRRLLKDDKYFHKYFKVRYRNKWLKVCWDNLKFDVAKQMVITHNVVWGRSLLSDYD